MLVALVGCAAPVRVGVTRINVLAEAAHPEPDGTCPATMRVRVLDGARNPVPNATVTSHEGERMNGPSLVPMQTAYATLPVITNAHGEATVCTPARLLKFPKDMFTHSTGAYIEAKFQDRVGRLLPPYQGAIILRMP